MKAQQCNTGVCVKAQQCNTSVCVKAQQCNTGVCVKALQCNTGVCVKAQQDAEMLRSVITPLEEEIDSLKGRLLTYEHQYGPLPNPPAQWGAGRDGAGQGGEDGVDASCPGAFSDAQFAHPSASVPRQQSSAGE